MRLGIIANPLAGKDVRRLSAGASVSSTLEKVAIVRRFVAALYSICEPDIHYLRDSEGITESALVSLGIRGHILDVQAEGTAMDTQLAAQQLQGVDVLVSLGGDGTNRAIARGWKDAPLIALSTGTNNAYAEMTEATAAGIAAAFVAQGQLPVDKVSSQSKTIHVSFNEGRKRSLALVDVVGTDDRFIGARAIVEPKQYVFAVLTQADAAKVGMVGVAGSCVHVGIDDECGVALTFNRGGSTPRTVKAAVAPGLVRTVEVGSVELIPLNTITSFVGPLVVAFDGEREEYLLKDQILKCVIQRDGPRQFNVSATLREAARVGLFDTKHSEFLLNA